MALSGGESEKLGNHYENTWTALCLLQVLSEKAKSIHFEPLGDVYSVVEFRLTDKYGGVEYHQVKRQHSRGAWNVSKLLEEGVLQGFATVIENEPEVKLVFVSQGESDELRNLTEEARSVPNYEEFKRFHLNGKRRAEQFNKIAAKTALRPERTYELLRAISVRGGPDRMIREMLRDRCHLLTMNSSFAQSLELKLRELSQTELHQDWDLVSLHQKLDELGIELSTRSFPQSLLAAISEQNSQYLDSIHQIMIGDERIDRIEASEVLDKLKAESEKPVIVITGGAGSGKSNVCAQILESAIQEGWLALGLRLDRLNVPPNTQKQLGEEFGFPDSPLRVLDGLGSGRKKLLLIDQLDALSTTSGRLTRAFESVQQILRDVKGREDCYIVLACREFDLTNDDRLRKIVDEKSGIGVQLKLGTLTGDQVSVALARTGKESGGLSANQLNILKTPIFLKIFTDLPETTSFRSEHELLGAFWSAKRKELLHSGVRAEVEQCVGALLRTLRANKSLSMPETSLRARYSTEVDILLSERILSHTRGMIGFFHESLFDYVFALNFVDSGEDLYGYILGQDQMLHCRGVVRQVLTFLRSEDFGRYITTLKKLLSTQNVRFHLKRSIFDWLRSLPDPSDAELDVLMECRNSGDRSLTDWSETALRSPAWFDLLHGQGLLQKWIEGDTETEADLAANLVWSVARERASAMPAILESWLDLREPIPSHAAKILQYLELDEAEGLAELYLKMLDRALLPLDEMPFGSQTRMMTFELAKRSPAIAMQVFEGWFKRVLDEARSKDVVNPFKLDPEDYGSYRFGSSEDVLKIAEGCPVGFANYFLPTVISLARENVQERYKNELLTDSIWYFKSYGSHLDLSDDILEGLILALRQLGAESPETCLDYIDQLMANLDLDVSCWILVRMLHSNGEAFANQALELITSLPASRSQSWTDCHNWESKLLIASITPFLTEAQLGRLFEAIIEHYESWEYLRKDDLRGRLSSLRGSTLGFSQFQLLSAIDSSRYPNNVLRRWQELERKFGTPETAGPKGVVVASFTTSPVNANPGILSDEQWLRAIEKCSLPDRKARRWDMGGERELARHLAEELQGDPKRLLAIIGRLESNTSTCYVTEALYKLRSIKGVDMDVLWDLIRIASKGDSSEKYRSVCYSIESMEFESVPPDIIDYLVKVERETALSTELTKDAPVNDLEHSGLNSDRGAVAGAIRNVLWKSPTSFDELRPTVELLVSDPSPAVRTQVASILIPLLNIDRDVAIELFLRLVSVDSDALLGSRYVSSFLRYAIETHFDQVKGVIVRMLSSDDQDAARHGSQLSTCAYLMGKDDGSLLMRAKTSMSPSRVGIADVAASWISDDRFWKECSNLLQSAFDDQDQAVRRAAGRCFSQMESTTFEQITPLINHYIRSRAFEDDAFRFFELLKATSAKLPDVVLEAFERTSQLIAASDATENQRTGRFMERNSEAVVRLYAQTADDNVRSRCLDIIDTLCKSASIHNPDEMLGTQFIE